MRSEGTVLSVVAFGFFFFFWLYVLSVVCQPITGLGNPMGKSQTAWSQGESCIAFSRPVIPSPSKPFCYGDYVAFSSTRHRSQPLDHHKRQDRENEVKDFFNWTSALTGATVQLFARSAWQSTWKRLPSAGETAQSKASLAPARHCLGPVAQQRPWQAQERCQQRSTRGASLPRAALSAGTRGPAHAARSLLRHGQTEEHLCWGDTEQISNCCFY